MLVGYKSSPVGISPKSLGHNFDGWYSGVTHTGLGHISDLTPEKSITIAATVVDWTAAMEPDENTQSTVVALVDIATNSQGSARRQNQYNLT